FTKLASNAIIWNSSVICINKLKPLTKRLLSDNRQEEGAFLVRVW
ncbi:hypothetical protein HMPREF9103_01379, partial [Lentilactobacillus parafarraginis F0439]